MEWVFTARKLLVAKETAKKFTVLSYGSSLAAELGQNIPKEYGGSQAELKVVGEGMKLDETKVEQPKVDEPKTEEPKTEEPKTAESRAEEAKAEA
jgi:hypothetical protein